MGKWTNPFDQPDEFKVPTDRDDEDDDIEDARDWSNEP